jgi:hypothetical protein
MKIFFSSIIRGEESTITKHYSVTAITLRYILSLSHNALCCGKMLLLLKVIDLVASLPLLLPKVIALTVWQKQ